MAKVRVGRLAEQIKKEVSIIIQNDLKDPRIAFVTVTGADLTNDLSQVTIHVSIYGTDDEIKGTLNTLERAKGHIRTELGKKIRFRHIPELTFKLDTSIEYGYKIDKLLKDIKDNEQ